jgi:hypothetical protein
MVITSGTPEHRLPKGYGINRQTHMQEYTGGLPIVPQCMYCGKRDPTDPGPICRQCSAPPKYRSRSQIYKHMKPGDIDTIGYPEESNINRRYKKPRRTRRQRINE